MEDFVLNFKILSDILDKKTAILEQILSITENQQTVLLNREAIDNSTDFFNMMNTEKQNLIPEVINCDTVFQKIFDRSSEGFEQNARENTKIIRLLQDKIKIVLDLDIKIRVLEEQNKAYVQSSKTKPRINVPKISKKDLLNHYEKNKKIK